MDSLLLRSFKKYEGVRGVHFYCQAGCKFLLWSEVVQFVNKLPNKTSSDFPDKLLSILANYDPDDQFLALSELNGETFIELYAKNHVK